MWWQQGGCSFWQKRIDNRKELVAAALAAYILASVFLRETSRILSEFFLLLVNQIQKEFD